MSPCQSLIQLVLEFAHQESEGLRDKLAKQVQAQDKISAAMERDKEREIQVHPNFVNVDGLRALQTVLGKSVMCCSQSCV